MTSCVHDHNYVYYCIYYYTVQRKTWISGRARSDSLMKELESASVTGHMTVPCDK